MGGWMRLTSKPAGNECTELGRALWQCLLWLQYIVLVDPAAAEEPVGYHRLSKQKHEAQHGRQQKELYKT
jgi:hypothetical protein